jgi:hypothetical protein
LGFYYHDTKNLAIVMINKESGVDTIEENCRATSSVSMMGAIKPDVTWEWSDDHQQNVLATWYIPT